MTIILISDLEVTIAQVPFDHIHSRTGQYGGDNVVALYVRPLLVIIGSAEALPILCMRCVR